MSILPRRGVMGMIVGCIGSLFAPSGKRQIIEAMARANLEYGEVRVTHVWVEQTKGVWAEATYIDCNGKSFAKARITGENIGRTGGGFIAKSTGETVRLQGLEPVPYPVDHDKLKAARYACLPEC